MTSTAGWHPDPMGRHELRFWDGAAWTDHVSSAGSAAVDPASGTPAPVTEGSTAAPEVGPAPAFSNAGGSSIWAERSFRLHSDLRAKRYALSTDSGEPLAWMDAAFALVDASGQPQLLGTLEHKRGPEHKKRYFVRHPAGGVWGYAYLRSRTPRTLKLRLSDAEGNAMGTLALGKGAEPAALEDADGRPVVRVQRIADERLAPVDAVTLVEPLEGSFHALAIATVVPHEHFRRFWD